MQKLNTILENLGLKQKKYVHPKLAKYETIHKYIKKNYPTKKELDNIEIRELMYDLKHTCNIDKISVDEIVAIIMNIKGIYFNMKTFL